MGSTGLRWADVVLAIWAIALAGAFIGVQMLGSFIYQRAVEYRQQDYRTHLAAAGAFAEAQDYARAFESVKEAIRLAPEAPQSRVALGDLHYRLGHWERAIGAYGRARQLGADALGIWLNTVWSHIEQEDYVSAAAVGLRGIESGFDEPALHRYVAEAFFRDEQYARALPHLRAAVEGFPNDLYLWEHLRFTHEQLGNQEEAERAQRHILSIQGRISESMRNGAPAP